MPFLLRISIAAIAAIVLIAAAYFIFIKPVSIVGVGLTEEESSALRLTLANSPGLPPTTFKLVPRGKAKLPSSARGAEIVIFHPYAGDDLKAFTSLPNKLNERFFPAIAGSIPTSTIAPLLVDHAELSFDQVAFTKAKLSAPASLEALEKAAAKLKNGSAPPVAIGGSDDRVLLAFIAYLAMYEGGPGAYDRLAQRIAAHDTLDRLALPSSAAGPELSRALTRIRDWTEKGYISHNWLDMGNVDTKAMVEEHISPIFFTFLSLHRLYSATELLNYATVVFPHSSGKAATNAIIAPILAAGVPTSAWRKGKAKAILVSLASADTNMAFASRSGEAPTISAAGSPDIQARDVRSWTLRSNRVLQGLGADAFASEAESKEFCAELRLLIKGQALQ
jgi:hypothetical protein